jgi:hypothetical protein
MHFVAELEGEEHILSSLEPCFQGVPARIVRLVEGWGLESSAFAECRTGREVIPIAEALVSDMHSILAIHQGPIQPLAVRSVLWINSQGRPFRRTLYTKLNVSVCSSQAAPELSPPTGVGSLGSRIIQVAQSNVHLREMLSLVGVEPLSWGQIYDVVEFLGGAAGISKAGFLQEASVERIRRTANHHRHLGSPRKYPLPAKVPTLPQARTEVTEIIKKWIATAL